jgi:hypothetical protein
MREMDRNEFALPPSSKTMRVPGVAGSAGSPWPSRQGAKHDLMLVLCCV